MFTWIGWRDGVEHRLGDVLGPAEHLAQRRLQRVEHLVGQALAALHLDLHARAPARSPATKAGSKLRAKLVAIAPGITLTTRIESSSSSRRSVLEMQFTACLVAP